MCMNCGCGRPDDDNGKPANITASKLRAAADANGQSLLESAQHILDAVRAADAPRRGSGLAEPAAASGGRGGGRGTPASES